jgi:hypothetical protein
VILLKNAENKNADRKIVESRGGAKHMGDAVGGACTFDILPFGISIFALFQENRNFVSSHKRYLLILNTETVSLLSEKT